MAHRFRYTAIVALTALGTALSAVGGWKFARASAPVNGPIVLVSIDSLRPDHLTAYGSRAVATPAIDALASDGVVFERAYSHAPQTLPAHVAILSGRLPFESGARDDAGFVVKRGERLLPQLLRERGYATAGIVSAYVLRAATGINQGFDFFDGEMPIGTPDAVQRDGMESEGIAERWLSAQSSSRIFLFLHLNEPHAPYLPPSRFEQYAPYDGEIAYADEIVGRLVHYLKSHQLYDQSTIVLLSDHGEGLGDHGEQEHGLFLHDATLRMPLIVKPAAGVGAGRRVADIVQQIDIVPTILDLVKAPVPGSLRGRSLTPLLEGSGRVPDEPVYSETLYGHYRFGWSPLAALTAGGYRYIKAPREELYDLARDGDEAENLATASSRPAHAQTLARLQKALDGLTAGVKDSRPAPLLPDERDRLETIGYAPVPADADASDAGLLADPKDKRDIAEAYGAAVALAQVRKWSQAIAVLQSVSKQHPEVSAVWTQIAVCANRIERYDLAAEAYGRLIALTPADADAHLGAAEALLKLRKLEEAQAHAEQAAQMAEARDAATRSAAHALLARIALNRRDADTALREAQLARQADRSLPMPAYVEGRLHHDQGQFADALPLFEQALAETSQAHARPIQDLHFYTADTLVRLDRAEESVVQYVAELRAYPQNTRARAGLANVYHALNRPDEAGEALAEMVRIAPTPDSYATAARLWRAFGDAGRAEALRAEARKLFAEPPGRTLVAR